MIDKIFACFILLLITSVESSLQTSIIFNRSSAWWTVWLYKIDDTLSISDFIIIIVMLSVVFKLLKNNLKLPSSPYLNICLFAILYLLIGLFYNLVVFTEWKYFLYDLKTIIYLTIPYLFLYFSKGNSVKKTLSYKNIFILYALASVIDFFIVSYFSQSDKPSYLGLSTPTTLLPFSVTLAGLIYIKEFKYRLMYLALIAIEMIISLNVLSLGAFINSIYIFGCITIIQFNLKKVRSYLLILSLILTVNIISVFLISNPFGNELLAVKSEGAVTRQIQLANALINSTENISGLIGKGLGSTWFERVPIPQSDIYSIGTSGGDIDTALASPVKFIFNWVPPVLIHKWGILGTFGLSYFISAYLYSAVKFNKDESDKLSSPQKQWSSMLLLTSLIFIIENFTYVGQLRPSLITSLLAFYVEQSYNKKDNFKNGT